jgi:uncharacterized protein YgbK (DUF1537 family)
METLVLAGIRSVLFFEPPDSAALARHPGIEAVGVAGVSRAMKTAAMDAELRRVFPALKSLHPPHLLYKICSTFDSSPGIGSIGRAIDIGAEVFPSPFVPVIGSNPTLGRYCVFGNLFARVGVGPEGAIHRIDRHPVMSAHPVTPADEGDLCVHLARQTRKRIRSLDVLKLGLTRAGLEKEIDRLLADKAEVILFDGLTQAQVDGIGVVLDGLAARVGTLFSVGPSSVTEALGACWRAGGRRRSLPAARAAAGVAHPVLVASGSTSNVTERQIAWALSHGFVGLPIDTARALEDGDGAPDQKTVKSAVRELEAGRNVLLHASRGPSDPRYAAARKLMKRHRLDLDVAARRIGGLLGRTVREILDRATVLRVGFAGGDSSSHAARTLGVESLQMIAPLTPGAPLCRARAPGSPADGIEIAFKGGQIGTEDYFARLARGGE